MSTPASPHGAPATAELVGLPAEDLAGLLDRAFADDAPTPVDDVPPAFAKDGSPYSLDELLSGLPPVADSEPSLEPALLLVEVESATAEPGHGWVDAAAPEPVPEEPPLDDTPPPPLDGMEPFGQVDLGTPMEALVTVLPGAPLAPEVNATSDDGDDDGFDDNDATTQALSTIAAALQTLAQGGEDAAPGPEEAPADDVLVLTDDFLADDLPAVPPEQACPDAEGNGEQNDDDDDGDEDQGDDPEWDPTTLSLRNIVAALHALADDGAPPLPASTQPAHDEVLLLTDVYLAEKGEEAAPIPPEPAADAPPLQESAVADAEPATEAPIEIPVEPEEDLLLLTDSLIVEAQVEAHAEAEAAAEPAPEAAADEIGDEAETARLAALVEAIIVAHVPAGTPAMDKGDATLPTQRDALATLLSDPPPDRDFAALDALYACWPKATVDSSSRALLATAQNLSRNFGLPGKLPMASAKAWRMLSPSVFEAELAQRLADVGTFIADWQKTQRTFLILEFGEIELIEYLFEALHPGYHGDALAGVMNFKVLSNRRMGLLRRIPNRMKKQIAPLLPDDKDKALVELVHAKALLERVAADTGFAPIVDAATKAQEEIEKMMKAVANIGAPPPPPGGGLALGRIG